MTYIYVLCEWLEHECVCVWIHTHTYRLLYLYIHFLIKGFCLVLFIAHEGRCVDKCLFFCLFCGLNNKYTVCKHLRFLLFLYQMNTILQCSLGIYFKIEHNCCIFFFAFCCLSLWHGLLIYNQTKKK